MKWIKIDFNFSWYIFSTTMYKMFFFNHQSMPPSFFPHDVPWDSFTIFDFTCSWRTWTCEKGHLCTSLRRVENNTPSPPKKKLPWLGKSPFSIWDTPGKINMEPKNHPIVKENHLPKHHFSGSMLIFQGVHRLKWLAFSIVISVPGLETFNLRKLNAFSPELHKWRKCNHTGE